MIFSYRRTLVKRSREQFAAAAAGHSYGRAAAYDASYDPRITAGIDLDGALYRYHDRPGVTKPFMFIFSDSTFDRYNKVREHYVHSDEELKAIGATREEIEQDTRNMEVQIGHFKQVAKSGSLLGVPSSEYPELQFATRLFAQE